MPSTVWNVWKVYFFTPVALIITSLADAQDLNCFNWFKFKLNCESESLKFAF